MCINARANSTLTLRRNTVTAESEVCNQLTENLPYRYNTKRELVFGPWRSRIDVLEFIITTNRRYKNVWPLEKEKSLHNTILSKLGYEIRVHLQNANCKTSHAALCLVSPITSRRCITHSTSHTFCYESV